MTSQSISFSRSLDKPLPVFLIRMNHRRTLWTVYAVNFLNAIGMWFFLPLLPIFLGRRGGSAALVGAAVAAGPLSKAPTPDPAGWAADRCGTRPVMLAAIGITAALFLAYLLALPAWAFIVVRFIQGGAQGAYWPAANGLVAEISPPQERGRVFGLLRAHNMAGMLIGPAIGGVDGLFF